jgi:hypothetical protein
VISATVAGIGMTKFGKLAERRVEEIGPNSARPFDRGRAL